MAEVARLPLSDYDARKLRQEAKEQEAKEQEAKEAKEQEAGERKARDQERKDHQQAIMRGREIITLHYVKLSYVT